MPRDSAGQWLDPNIGDPRTHQPHIGYAHTLAANTVVSVDYTHVEGRNEMRQINLNPIVNGRRVLADDFVRVYGVANVLSNVNGARTDPTNGTASWSQAYSTSRMASSSRRCSRPRVPGRTISPPAAT